MEHINISSFCRRTTSAAFAVWKGFSMMSTPNKSPKLAKKIGTHSGVFHCDEALACFMLKVLPDYADAEIVRSRDDKVLQECDIVVDVGSVYNPEKKRFDHHQREFNETLNSVRPDLSRNKFNTIRLSSAGLIYAHYGIEILDEILKKSSLASPTDCLQKLFLHVYGGFVEELDAIDNGVPMYEGEPKYRINTHLSARIGRLNPAWNEENPPSQDVLFEKAMETVGREFTEDVIYARKSWWPARECLKQVMESRQKIDESGQILLMEGRCSWKSHLYDLEEELNIPGQIKFVVFHDNSGGGSWRVQGVPVQPGSFVCRVFLRKEWQGVRDEDLSEIAKISDCIFCHSTGFIGGNKTKEGALQMAKKSLDLC